MIHNNFSYSLLSCPPYPPRKWIGKSNHMFGFAQFLLILVRLSITPTSPSKATYSDDELHCHLMPRNLLAPGVPAYSYYLTVFPDDFLPVRKVSSPCSYQPSPGRPSHAPSLFWTWIGPVGLPSSFHISLSFFLCILPVTVNGISRPGHLKFVSELALCLSELFILQLNSSHRQV